MELTMRKICTHAFGLLSVLLVAGLALVCCAAPVKLIGDFGGTTVRVALPPLPAAKSLGPNSARVLQGSAGWIELAVNDGASTSVQRQNYDGSQSSVSFKVNIQGGKNYTLTATSGSTNDQTSPKFSVSTELSMANVRSNVTLYLSPVEPVGGWEIVESNWALDPPTMRAGDFHTYHFKFGNASRVCLHGLPANFVFYAQDKSTGAPIVPALNANGIFVVEQSAVGASGFLLTFYNAGNQQLKPVGVVASFDNYSHFVAVYQLGATRPGCMTHFGSTIFLPDNLDDRIYSFNPDTYANSFFTIATILHWGIATADGQTFIVCANDTGLNAVKCSANQPTSVFVDCTNANSVQTCLPACVIAGDNASVFITSNTKSCVYKANIGDSNVKYDRLNIVSKSLPSVSGICRNGTDLYVAALGNKMIYKIDSLGMWPENTKEFAYTGTMDMNFVACDGKAVYYTQEKTIRRMGLDSTSINASTLVADFTAFGTSPGGLDVVNGVVYVACDDGNIYRLY